MIIYITGRGMVYFKRDVIALYDGPEGLMSCKGSIEIHDDVVTIKTYTHEDAFDKAYTLHISNCFIEWDAIPAIQCRG